MESSSHIHSAKAENCFSLRNIICMRARNSLTVGYILDLMTINDGVEPCGLGCNSICQIMAKLRLYRLAT